MSLIHFSASRDRRGEMLRYAGELEEMGHRVLSRWLTSDRPDVGPHDLYFWVVQQALESLEDVKFAWLVICFTQTTTEHDWNGRHVELGAALGLGKRVIVVGPVEHSFHRLPTLLHFETWPAAYAHLRECHLKTAGGYMSSAEPEVERG